MKTKILTTEEIFRVIYDDGYFERLMKQTYNNGKPFYYVMKGEHDMTPVETSSENLADIENHLTKCFEIDSDSLNAKHNKNNPKVKAVIEYCLAKQKEFLTKLKVFSEMESSILFVKENYPTAKCVSEKNPFSTHQIVDERGVQISWVSGKVKSESEAWASAKDAILGRAKSVRKMNELNPQI